MSTEQPAAPIGPIDDEIIAFFGKRIDEPAHIVEKTIAKVMPIWDEALYLQFTDGSWFLITAAFDRELEYAGYTLSVVPKREPEQLSAGASFMEEVGLIDASTREAYRQRARETETQRRATQEREQLLQLLRKHPDVLPRTES